MRKPVRFSPPAAALGAAVVTASVVTAVFASGFGGPTGTTEPATAAAAPAPRQARRLNVLFVIADDLNRSVPAYGNRTVRTPNLDRLAARAVRFDRAYCQYPVCSPSRTSFLSGRRPEQTGLFGNEGSPRTGALRDAVFLPEYFRQQGYFTARVGKVFHIGRDLPECWDVSEEGTPGNAIVYTPQEVDKLGLKESVTAAGALDGDAGESGAWTRVTDGAEAKLVDPRIATRVAELLAQGAKGRAESGKPFFVACGFRRPHLPWLLPASEFARYPDAAVPLPDRGGLPQPRGVQKRDGLATDASRRDALRAYYASITFMDRQLGTVLDAMDRLRLWDDTVVVMLGDHGYHLGDRGGYWGKGVPYEPSCGAPLFVSAPAGVTPRSAAGRASPRVVEFVDFYPTLADICGLPAPSPSAAAAPPLAGRSLRPLLEDPSRPWDHPAFTMGASQGKPSWLAVSTERWRYVEYADPSRPAELYDVRADPGERRNLAGDPARAADLARMKALATAHRKRFGG